MESNIKQSKKKGVKNKYKERKRNMKGEENRMTREKESNTIKKLK